MGKELNNSKDFKYEELNFENLSLNEAYNKYKKNDLLKENSLINDIFYIYLNKSIECKICHKINNSFQKFLDFPLNLDDNDNEITINNLINKNFNEINVKYKCSKCKKVTNHLQKIKICELSEYLILSKQIDDNDSINIIINEELNLRQFVNINLCKDKMFSYELISIINHTGNKDSGHYYSLIKINNNWFEFNDENVTQISKPNLNSNISYIMFYQKKKIKKKKY